MTALRFIILLGCLMFVSPDIRAAEIPASVAEECTASKSIYYPTRIKVNAALGDEQKKEAVMDALTGPWIYEDESAEAIYAGYHVRKHYLRFAIVYTGDGLTSIICDSKNMKQRETSIHRKAPQWKETLNSRIRLKISSVAKSLKSGRIHLRNLTELRKQGFVTGEEFETIKRRITAE